MGNVVVSDRYSSIILDLQRMGPLKFDLEMGLSWVSECVLTTNCIKLEMFTLYACKLWPISSSLVVVGSYDSYPDIIMQMISYYGIMPFRIYLMRMLFRVMERKSWMNVGFHVIHNFSNLIWWILYIWVGMRIKRVLKWDVKKVNPLL